MAQADVAGGVRKEQRRMPAIHSRSELLHRVSLFIHRPLNAVALAILIVALVCASWPVDWLPHNPTASDLELRLKPPIGATGAAPEYPLGTDNLGRDMLSRIIHGTRYSLLISASAVALSGFLGLFAGLAAGFYRGWIDDVVMRLVDIQLAFPTIILIIAVVGVFGPSLLNLILILGISGWARYARFVRGSTLSVRENEYILAARAVGAENLHIMIHHILPNLVSEVIVLTSFELARLLLLESGLSFLGLGVQPPTPSWGGMIGDGRNYLYEGWWISAFPGAAIVMAVLAFNFLGDGLRDILDPHTRFE
jgi:peptide/nickel transport system permease protein